MNIMILVLQILGFVLVTAGIALVSVPAAVIVGGLCLVALGTALERGHHGSG